MIYLDLGANGSTDSTKVDDFGSVDYRTSPGTVEHNILLFKYEQTSSESLSIYTQFENNRYDINHTGPGVIHLDVATLDDSYSYYHNNTSIPNTVEIHELIV